MRSIVRPIISFCLIFTLSYLFISGGIEARELLILIGPIIGFYFGERSALKKPDK